MIGPSGGVIEQVRPPATKNPPGRGSKRVDWATKEAIYQLMKQSGNAAATARQLGLSSETVRTHWKKYGLKDSALPVRLARPLGSFGRDIPPPLDVNLLKADAIALLDDFPAFRAKYFQRMTPWFQAEAARLLADNSDPARVILWPPGHGKTTLVSHDWIVWQIVRMRARREWFSCLYVSKTQEMAERYVNRVKRTLEVHEALQHDYGRFRSPEPEIWKKGEILVEGFTEFHDEKEPTLIAAGAQSHIYSLRVTNVLVDDLVDKELSRSPDVSAKVHEWLREELETRVNAGGMFVYVGTLWAGHDVPSKLIAMKDPDTGEKLYKLITFKAHDVARCRVPANGYPDPDLAPDATDCHCKGPCHHHPSQPEGCTLWPERYYWRPRNSFDHIRSLKLLTEKNGKGRFDFQYNQISSPASNQIVRAEWIPPCLDHGRAMWQFPDANIAIFCSIDPTGTAGYAGIQVWGYSQLRDMHYLIAQYRDHTVMPQYSHIVKTWTERIRAVGYEPTWILEENMADFLIRSYDFQQLRWALGGLKLIQHRTTGRNKWDANMGVETLGPLYENARVSLPYGDRSAIEQTDLLTTELIAWPTGETDDLVMAHWIYLAHVKQLVRGPQAGFLDNANIPPYLLARRKMIDLGGTNPAALGDVRVVRNGLGRKLERGDVVTATAP